MITGVREELKKRALGEPARLRDRSGSPAGGSGFNRRPSPGKGRLLGLFGLPHFEHGEEGFLRDLDAPDALHALLAFLLLF